MAAKSLKDHLAALKAHYRQHGHFLISGNGEHRWVYRWAVTQRRDWHLGRLALPVERELRRLGFPLEVEACEWEFAFAPVVAAYRRTGHLPSPTTMQHQWLTQQRELLRRHLLPETRVARLKAVGVRAR